VGSSCRFQLNSKHTLLVPCPHCSSSVAQICTMVYFSFIVMASTNKYARKILNSPTYAEPCLVHSAKAVLEPDNWVFLTGKVHSDYRRVLNSLFTKTALA
jgi:cytochrome P450